MGKCTNQSAFYSSFFFSNPKFNIQWNLYRRPPAKGDHLPSRPLSRSPRRFLLYIAPAKGDHLSNATATIHFEGPNTILPCGCRC